ncbi:MAG: polysaccharide biosynthesis protein, partial [Bacteroidaceae bacterium]|nr:polysaccharide biosynthesis protein [Bacteroidaceae bacterium]
EACRLVMEAATMSKGNEIFVFDMGQPVKIVDMARRMIELAGYVPDKDIKITFTGLRAGEKLYEEVLANSENTIPTNHQRIKIAKVREYDYQEVHQVVNKLVYLSAQVQIPEMVALMKKTVPEFKTTNVNFQKY